MREIRDRLRPSWYRILELSPRAYTAYVRRRNASAEVVRPGRDIVVVGSAGSGNTFARVALQVSNPGIDVASHVHSWTQAAEAVRYGLPLLVLAREPLSAISSALVRFPDRRPKSELREYSRLYERLLPFVRQAVVADFPTVVERFGSVIRSLNERFLTEFKTFDHDDPRSTTEVLEHIDAYDRIALNGDATRTARPTSEKDERKQLVASELRSSALRPFLDDCDRVYRRLVEVAAAAG